MAFEVGDRVVAFGPYVSNYGNKKSEKLAVVQNVVGDGEVYCVLKFDDPHDWVIGSTPQWGGRYLRKVTVSSERVFEYLTGGEGTREYRQQAFIWLSEKLFFFSDVETQLKILTELITENPLGFCDDGLDKAAAFFGISRPKEFTITIDVVVDGCIDNSAEDVAAISESIENYLIGEEVWLGGPRMTEVNASRISIK